MSRLYLIHAWGETPESCWYPWLKKELEARGFEVVVPAMPDTETPEIEPWVGLLSKMAPSPDENTYFVGHSIGGQTILRYLARLPKDKRVGGVFFVTPWTHLENLEKDSTLVAKSWLETPIDFELAKSHSSKFFAFFSDNDPWVPLSEEKSFQERLDAKTQVIHEAGHLDEQTKFPELLNLLQEVI